LEKLGIPTAPVSTDKYDRLLKQSAFKKGMPLQRYTFVPNPVWGREALHRQYIEGKNPITGRPVMQEIVEALTKPLTEEEKRSGLLDRSVPRLLEPASEEELQELFLKNGWTDKLPILIPTEKRVAEMLKGTSHPSNEVVGKMAPSAPHEAWEYTVEKVAINAVMAGAIPEYFPIILAIASTGVTSLHSSVKSVAMMAVVNGPIRDEIGMNSGPAALGPFNHANATIGRAWTLLSINLAGSGVVGETYIGSQGNNLNYNNICFAEHEQRLPSGWKPFHVVKGFKPEESAVSLFAGWSLVHQFGTFVPITEAVALKKFHQETTLPHIIRSVLGTFTCASSTIFGKAGATVLIDPGIAKDFKEIHGFTTKEKLSEWFHQNTLMTVKDYWNTQQVPGFTLPMALSLVEPFASYLNLPGDALIPRFYSPETINILVVGAETNPNWQAGDFFWQTTASVDKWR
jgi:hypothetical protein